MTSRFARRTTTAVATAAGMTLLMATPALAAVPSGWSTPEHVKAIQWLVVLVFCPLGLTLLITLLVAGPAFLKGQGLTGGQPVPVPGHSSERPAAH